MMKNPQREPKPIEWDYRVNRFLIDREKKLLDGCALPVVAIPVNRALAKLIVRIGKSSSIGVA